MSDLPERANVSMMARKLGMSRTRLYQLIGNTFPSPSLDPDGRPYFTKEQQKQILEIYQSNVGLDGKSMFFRPRVKKTFKPKATKTKGKICVFTEAVLSENDRLRKALRDLVDRCDGPEGVRADGSNISTLDAHGALGDLSPMLDEIVSEEEAKRHIASRNAVIEAVLADFFE